MISARTLFALLIVVASSLVARAASAQTVTFKGVVNTYPSSFDERFRKDANNEDESWEPLRRCYSKSDKIDDCEIAKGGRNVTITTGVSVPSTARDAAGCRYCYRKWSTYKTVTSDVNTGEFSVSIPTSIGACSIPEESRLVRMPDGTVEDFYCPAQNDYYLSVSATAQGSDSAAISSHGHTSPPTPNSVLACPDAAQPSIATPCNPFQAPHAISPRGHYWARMFGAPNLTAAQRAATYPIFLIEGFDPDDGMTSSDLAHFVKWSKLPDGSNLLDYVRNPANNLTLYVLNSGKSGGNSIKGPVGDYRAGLAYDAMMLIRKISVERHPSRAMVVGGYSMGGLVAREGLFQWCRGLWDNPYAAPVDRLEKNCEDVSLFFSGDAPLDGAMIPMALQHFIHDPEIIDLSPRVDTFRRQLDSPAAREILRKVVTRSSTGAPICSTACVPYGCSSIASDFDDGCQDIVAQERSDLLAWAPINMDVKRYNGEIVPAIALSVGPSPTSMMPSVSTTVFPFVKPFLNVNIDWAWDMTLYHRVEDNVPGSRLDKLKEARTSATASCDGDLGWEPTNQGIWIFGECYRVEPKMPYPTFVPSASSLLWNVSTPGRQSVAWKGYWFNSVAANHAEPLPTFGTAFLLSWINEYTKGLHDRPPCADPMISNLATRSKGGSVSQCRGPEAPTIPTHQRICGDDLCDPNEFCPEDCGF